MEPKPKNIERLEQYASRIGAVIKIEETARGYRLLVGSRVDPAINEMLVSYLEGDLELALEEDDLVTLSPEWRRLGIIVGSREVDD
ncbi:MAG TPA: hypothetical protein VGJ57_00780 [Nitrospirales bacterium]